MFLKLLNFRENIFEIKTAHSNCRRLVRTPAGAAHPWRRAELKIKRQIRDC